MKSNYVNFDNVYVLKKNTVLAISSIKLNQSLCVKIKPRFCDSLSFDNLVVESIHYAKVCALCMQAWFPYNEDANENFDRIWTNGPNKCAYFINENSKNGIGVCVEEYYDEKLGKERLALSKVQVADWKKRKKAEKTNEMITSL